MAQQKTPDTIKGIVRQFNSQNTNLKNISTVIWTFRLMRYDKNQNELPPVPVEIRGYEISGIIADGDEVEIQATWTPPAILSISKLYNCTTGSEVTVKKLKTISKGCIATFLIIVVFLIILLIASIARL
jgi:hypothetical protein